MRNFFRRYTVILLAAMIASGSALAGPKKAPVSWREQYAYSLGMAAYP